MKNFNRKIVLLIFAVTLLIHQGITYAAPPVFDDGDSKIVSVVENTAVDTEIVSLAVTDPDDDVAFVLMIGSASPFGGDLRDLTFEYSRTEAGKYKVVIKNTVILDYETATSYGFTIDVSDQNNESDSIYVNIRVTNDTSDDTPNNSPTFDDGDSTTRFIAENLESGANVGEPILATDIDNDTLTYRLSSGDVNSFSINSGTGQLSSRTQFDYETKESYEVTITVTDGKSGTDSITVTISVTNDTSDDLTRTTRQDVTNSVPVFTDGDSTTRSIAENVEIGTNIGLPVSATDDDSGDTLEYTLGGTDAGSFSIVSTTGQLQTNAALDYENKKSYKVNVSVSDGKGGTDIITVTITVTNDTSDDSTGKKHVIVVPPTDPVSKPVQQDVTNSVPVFTDGDSTTRSIAENVEIGTNIGLPVSATDDDSGDTLEYTLGGTDAGSFSIVSTTGQLQTNAALDYENKKSYEVNVSVSDGKGGTDIITVTISITNDTSDDPTTQPKVTVIPQTDPVSEQQVAVPEKQDATNNVPAFTDGESTTRSITENVEAGTNIGSPVFATDGDNSDTLEYTLSGADAGLFSIDNSTGQLKTVAALDYETKNSYEVTVTVSDGKGGTASITVTINIANDTSDDLTTQQQVIVPQTDPVSEQQVADIGQPDDTDTGEQNSQTGQQDNVQQPKSEADPESEPNYTVIPFDYEREGVGKVVFSELMLARPEKYPQWIELYNTTDQDIDMNGWKVVGRYLDDKDAINILESQVISKSWTIEGKGTVLIVSFTTPNSRDRISNGLADQTYALDSNRKNFWNYEGLVLELQDAEGNPIDRIGNLNEEDEIVWEIPLIVREKRISLIRRLKSIRSQEYNFLFGVKEFGWFPAEEVERLIKNRSQYYYGRYTDIGSPGYRTEDGVTLPVTLSSFRAQLTKNGQIILNWVTESELDNAGFNILRSQSKQGPFVQVNPKLIQGAGTTGKRSSYTWTDTTAKPDVASYYRLEDVSFTGFRNQLGTVRTRGHVSASERYITQWGNLKK